MRRVALACLVLALVHGFSFLGKSDEESFIENSTPPENYGVDVTFPIHHPLKKDSIFKRRYDNWIAGCAKAGSRVECEATERARLEMSLSQPKIHHNYTEIGFKKMKVPEAIFKEILDFWETNKANEKEEKWSRGYTYVNYWDTPSYMVSLEDKQFRGGWALKDRIWNGLNPILSEWIGGKELTPTSMYGIRVYKRGAFLATRKYELMYSLLSIQVCKLYVLVSYYTVSIHSFDLI